MDWPLQWTWLCFNILFGNVLAADDKGVIVSVFPDWYQGRIDVYHKDASTLQPNDLPKVTSMDAGQSQITSMVPNVKDNQLHFLDANTYTLFTYQNFSFHLNNTYQKTEKVHSGISATTSQIAYDWLADNIYWTDGYLKWVAVHPNTKTEDVSLFKVLVKDHLEKPEGIAVDPYQRYLFWSDFQIRNSKIERSSLTGENRKVIVQSDTPIWISSLAVDTDNQMIYWADIGRQTIEMCNYEGDMATRKVVVRELGANFLQISLSKDVICATEYKYYYVMCYDKATGNNTWDSSYNQVPWGIAVYDPTLQKQVSHPCQNKNCEHMCFNIDQTTARCDCKEGYELQADGQTCKSTHGFIYGKGIIVANETDACMYDSHIINNGSRVPHCFLTNLTGVQHMAVDSHDRILYYVDSNNEIVKVDMITTQTLQKFGDQSGGARISGLALDWTTKNLLWTDSTAGTIVEYSTQTGAFTDLVSGLDQPSYVAVDPHNRQMYWLEGTGMQMSLHAANMDPNNLDLRTIWSRGQVAYAKGLFYDTLSKKLYLDEGGDMVSVKTDGTDVFYHAYTGAASHFVVYKSFIVWTTGDNYLEIAHFDSFYSDFYYNLDYMGDLSAVGIYDIDLQPMEINNCTNFNGGCEHICQPTGTSTVCLCNFGYQLQSDGKSCSNDPFEDSFAIIADVTHDRLYQVSLIDSQLRALDIPDVNVPVTVIYDSPKKMLYWSNAIYTQIRAAPLKSTKSELIYDTWSTLPVGLAFDYSSGLLYFSTEYWYSPSYIGVIHPHVGKLKTLINNLDLPKNIALYPSKGLMFWTDISTSASRESYIGSAFMDGSNQKKIVSSGLQSPNGIVIDFTTDRLYWADAELSTISSCNFDGSGFKELLSEPNAGIVGLDISPPHLYYVGRNKQRISKMHLNTTQKVPFMNDVHALGRIESITVYPEQKQPLNAACSKSNGGCALFCLPIPNGRICGCEDGETLNDDGTSCSGHISCTTSIPNAILEQRCVGHSTGVCDYTCVSGYSKTSPKLECKEDGTWNVTIFTACQSLTGTCSETIPNGHVTSTCNRKIGETCTFECNIGHLPAVTDKTIQCLSSGAWSKPVETLCKMSQTKCPNSIPNGQLASDCTFIAGSHCDLTCNANYQKNPAIDKIICLSDGSWNFKADQICLPITDQNKCGTSLPNGVFTNGCSFMPGSSCDYTCSSGYEKNQDIQTAMCMTNGQWNYNINSLCTKVVTCAKTLPNGYFSNQCSYRAFSPCQYSCNSGYDKNTALSSVICMGDGNWNFRLNDLCILAKAACVKPFQHGKFKDPCAAKHGDKCDYVCDAGFLQQPIVQHVICHDGKWTVDRNSLCIADQPTITSAQKNEQSGTTTGGVVGIVIAVLVVIVLVVLVLVYFVWWRKRPKGQLMADTNINFKRFDDRAVPIDNGVGGFSNPIAQTSDYGNFGNCRDEGYVTADINPTYNGGVDTGDISVAVGKSPVPSPNGNSQTNA